MVFEKKLKTIDDPILEFDSSEHKSTDPINGLENWDPNKLPDLECIRVSAICQSQYVNVLKQFWDHLRNGYNGNRYVPYLGFRESFAAPITDILSTVNPDVKSGDIDTRFAASVRDIGSSADIVFVVLPYDFPQEAMTMYNEIKAASFQSKTKTQCIRRNILGRVGSPDHAIDLWNIGVGIFTKVGGTPWVLSDRMSDVGCFVGLVTDSVKRGTQTVSDKAGICEVVDNYGSHVIWAKEELPSLSFAKEEGRTVREIDKKETTKMIESCLEKYCRQRLGSNYHDRMNLLSDKLVVFHLTDDFSKGVLETMEKAITDFGLERYQIIHLKQDTPYRLYSNESNDMTPLRGTVFEVNDKNAVLYTHGKREYHRGTVHNVYTRNKRGIKPIGVEILKENKGVPIYETCKHVINLTGLCWYTTDIEMKMPVTIKIARRLGMLWKRGVLSDFADVRYVL